MNDVSGTYDSAPELADAFRAHVMTIYKRANVNKISFYFTKEIAFIIRVHIFKPFKLALLLVPLLFFRKK